MNPYFQFTVPVFTRTLTNLNAILEKAKTFVAEGKITEAELLEKRFFPDMLPFVSQVRIAADNAKGASARLAGVEIPKMEDNEKSLDELIARINKTLAFLATITPEQFEGASSRKIHLPWMPEEALHYKADDYVNQFVLANFYFHVVTAYDLLRNAGLNIGKADYIGNIPMVKE